MTFVEMLKARWSAADTLLCVGLDPDPARFPEQLHRRDDAIFEFCARSSMRPPISYALSSRRSRTSHRPAAKTRCNV